MLALVCVCVSEPIKPYGKIERKICPIGTYELQYVMKDIELQKMLEKTPNFVIDRLNNTQLNSMMNTKQRS